MIQEDKISDILENRNKTEDGEMKGNKKTWGLGNFVYCDDSKSVNSSSNGDADYVVMGINDSVFSESLSDVQLVFKDNAWSFADKHDEYAIESQMEISRNIADNFGSKGNGNDNEVESSGMITNNFELKVHGELCEEDVEVRGSQSKNSNVKDDKQEMFKDC